MLPDCEAPDSELADLLIAQGTLNKTGLKAVLRSMVIDAFIVLTTHQLAEQNFVSGTRFRSPMVHWTAAYLRLSVDSVSAAAGKKAASLARLELATTDLPQLRDLEGPFAVLKAEHWALAGRIDGSSSIRQLARDCAIPLYEAVERVGYLTKRGLCATRPGVPDAEGYRPQLLPSPPPEPAAPLAPSVVTAPEAAAVPARRTPVRLETQVAAFPEELRQEPPSPEQLRRVLEGLRRLD